MTLENNEQGHECFFEWYVGVLNCWIMAVTCQSVSLLEGGARIVSLLKHSHT